MRSAVLRSGDPALLHRCAVHGVAGRDDLGASAAR